MLLQAQKKGVSIPAGINTPFILNHFSALVLLL